MGTNGVSRVLGGRGWGGMAVQCLCSIEYASSDKYENKGVSLGPGRHDISVHCEVLVWLFCNNKRRIKRAKRENHFVAKPITHMVRHLKD